MSSPSPERGAIRAALQQQGERCPYCSMPSHLGRELHAGYCVVEKARSELAALEAAVVAIRAQLATVEKERDEARAWQGAHLYMRDADAAEERGDRAEAERLTARGLEQMAIATGTAARVSADASKERNDADV